MNIPATQEDSSLVLIVEDDRFMRLQLRYIMEDEGYEVAQASNPEEGLAAYTSHKPDIILLDAMMPVMDGFTCCTQLRALPGGDRIPILMIACLDDEESVERAFEAGATDYVTKPIHWAVLRQRVRRLLQASRATEELQQHFLRERLMGVITQHIRQSLNLEETLNTTASEVRQFLQTDRTIIYRFESDGSGVVVVESVDDRWTPILGKTILDPCLGKSYIQSYKHGRIRAVEDIYTAGLKQCYIDLLSPFQVRANLVVPILQGENLWGLLIAHHCSQPRQWQQSEVDFLCALANQAAIAIQQSELYQQVQRLNSNLEQQVQERTAQLQQALEYEATLKRITDKVRDSLDESQILQTAVQELALVLGIGYCDTALYNLEQGISTICYQYTISSPSSQGRVVQMADWPEIYSQLLSGQYIQFCPSQPNPSQFVGLACPIFDNQGVLGDMWLFSQKDYVFNELEIRLVQQVANQCAIAIRQARLYQASQAQVQELEKLNQLKDDFLNTVSHELKTPVSNIKMGIQMLEFIMNQKRGQLSDVVNINAAYSQAARYFQLLNDACDRELDLINDLLQLQRLNAGVQPLEKRIIDLKDWIPYVVDPFEYQIQNHQQILQVDIAPELPSIASDPFSLERILTELLNNACKYTPPGEKITVAVRPKGGMIQLSVSNSGVEIPSSEIPRIFDKFYRIPSGDDRQHSGTGIGLALVKKLVDYLGGSIQVESTSKTTCFLVELPINQFVNRQNGMSPPTT